MAQVYHNKNLTASTVEATAILNGEFTIDTLEVNNDSLTVDLHVKFTGLYSTTSDYIIIKPMESLKVSNTNVSTMLYKTLSGSASFRVMGLNSNG